MVEVATLQGLDALNVELLEVDARLEDEKVLVGFKGFLAGLLHAEEALGFFVFFFEDDHRGEQREEVADVVSRHNDRVLQLRVLREPQEDVRRELGDNQEHLLLSSLRLGSSHFLLRLVDSQAHSLIGYSQLLARSKGSLAIRSLGLLVYLALSQLSLQGK